MGLRANPGPGSRPELLLFQPNTRARMGADSRKMPGGMARGVLISSQGLCAGGRVGTWRLQGLGMVQRIAAVGVVTFVLACGAVCQDASQSLPDAPSAQAAIRAREVFAEQVHSPFTLSSFTSVHPPFKFDGARLPDAMRQKAFSDPDKQARTQKHPDAFFAKYLSTASANQKPDHAADSGFMGRATHAAAGIFFTRDDAGRGRLNTSYFLRALTLAASDTASRPYWRRSATEPFSDFGSTVGNDAGMNLLHEFGPGIQHMVKSHGPKFVARITGAPITHK